VEAEVELDEFELKIETALDELVEESELPCGRWPPPRCARSAELVELELAVEACGDSVDAETDELDEAEATGAGPLVPPSCERNVRTDAGRPTVLGAPTDGLDAPADVEALALDELEALLWLGDVCCNIETALWLLTVRLMKLPIKMRQSNASTLGAAP
jgi:hypothetical protein